MHKFSYILGCLLGASTLAIALPGYADIPPADYCSVEGASCNNAAGAQKAGICSAAQCSRRLPDGSFTTYACLHCVAPGGEGGASSGGEGGASSGGDGGVAGGAVTGGTASTTGGAAPATGGTTSATGGKTSTTGGTANATGGASPTTGGTPNATGGVAGAGGDTTKDDDGGCSLSPLAAERGLAGLMTALGLSALFFARRRR